MKPRVQRHAIRGAYFYASCEIGLIRVRDAPAPRTMQHPAKICVFVEIIPQSRVSITPPFELPRCANVYRVIKYFDNHWPIWIVYVAMHSNINYTRTLRVAKLAHSVRLIRVYDCGIRIQSTLRPLVKQNED